MTSPRTRSSAGVRAAQLLAVGYRPAPLVRDRASRRWWGLAQDVDDRWVLVNVPDSLTEDELSSFDPTGVLEDGWPSYQWPPLAAFPDVVGLILAIIRRRRTTTIEGQWDRWAVLAYLDALPGDERALMADHLASVEPEGWVTLEELRRYDVNRQVKGRESEAVTLLKETAARMWPRTMTPGRLTQLGKRCGDEVFMVLPYESWRSSAEAALTKAAQDPGTTTGDTLRFLAPDWPPT